MLSEKSYWIILIVTFIGIALLIWLWFIPYGIVEYNLGVNLLTSSIFMILTIVFLSWLFTVRERVQWKTVKDEVYSSIESNLYELFDSILTYVEKGTKIKLSLMEEKDNKIRKQMCFNELCKLKDAEEIILDTRMSELLLESRDLLDLYFLSAARRLSDIETKYSKFLSPQLTLSLMTIQHEIWSLENASSIFTKHIEYKKLSKEYAKRFGDIKKVPHRLVSLNFKGLIEEIYKIHEMGIEISFL